MTLKTKLRLAILGLVLAVVLAYSWLYISMLTKKEYEASMDLGIYVTREISEKAKHSVDASNAASPGLMTSADPVAMEGTLSVPWSRTPN